MEDRNNRCRRVLAYRSELGEGPVWDGKQGRLLWVDILKGHVHEWYPESEQHSIHKFPLKIGSVALYKGHELIAATNEGFTILNLLNTTFEIILAPGTDKPTNRFNDGKCDPAGRFWAGTMSERETGTLYRLDTKTAATKVISNITCSNGLAWSPDSKTMYYIDSGHQNITAFDYNLVDGNINNARQVIEIPRSDGIPDGMTIDREGMLWVALWGGSKVIRFDPVSGQKLHEVKLPVSQVTSCTFGGADYNDLYITTASEGLTPSQLSKQPLAGSIFVVENMPYKGKEAVYWNGSDDSNTLIGK